MAVIKIVPMPGPQGPEGSGGEFNSTVPFTLNDTNGDPLITITETGTGTTRIATPQDDLSLRSARDITLFAGNDGPGNVYIGWGDAQYTPDSPNRVATIGDIQNLNTGDITFDGVKIIGAGEASGDGYGNGTIELVPDIDLETDQYLIIDPTAPNHIHIRAGGIQDDSQAELILGGERNQVAVNDMSRNVRITTAVQQNVSSYENENLVSNENFITTSPAIIDIGYKVNIDGTDYTVTSVQNDQPVPGKITVTAPGATFNSLQSYTFIGDSGNNNYWYFSNDGTLYGPAMGGLIVAGIAGKSDSGLDIYSNNSMTITANGGDMNFYMDGAAYIGPADSENRIAQIKDLNNRISPAMIRYQPTFAATGLTFTGSGTTYPTYNSYYTKAGNMVSFVIEVDCSTVTNFGTGQYQLELPFPPAIGYNHFSGWAQVDTNVNPDVPNGHVVLNVDHAGITSTLDLHYLKQAGGAHTPIIEGLFLQGTPVTLTTTSKIYVNGTYIAQ